MSKGGTPPSPDYSGAAVAQGQQNLQLAQYSLGANRPNQITPYGTQTWEYNPPSGGAYGLQGQPDPAGGGQTSAAPAAAPAPSGSSGGGTDPNTLIQQGGGGGVNYSAQPLSASGGTADGTQIANPGAGQSAGMPQSPGGWTSVTTLSPAQQQLLNQQQALQTQQGQLAGGQLNQFASQGAPSMQSAQDIYNQAYGAQTSRLDPQWQQASQQQAAQLQAQGITPGMAAYDNSMRSFNQAKNDAYQQAQLAAIQTMPQTYGLATQQYELPLQMYSSLMSGASPTSPSLASSGMMSTPQGGNLLGAAQSAGQYGANLFSAQQAQQNSLDSGLMSLAGNLGYGYLTGGGGANTAGITGPG